MVIPVPQLTPRLFIMFLLQLSITDFAYHYLGIIMAMITFLITGFLLGLIKLNWVGQYDGQNLDFKVDCIYFLFHICSFTVQFDNDRLQRLRQSVQQN